MSHIKSSIVIVDDDTRFLTTFTKHMLSDKNVDSYANPTEFLANLSKYNKNTKIILDNHFGEGNISGIEIAEKLHTLGYKHLYLLSGTEFKAGECPVFLIPILKDDLDHIQRIFGN